MTEEQYKIKVAELAAVLLSNQEKKLISDPSGDIETAVHAAQNLLNFVGIKPESEYVP